MLLDRIDIDSHGPLSRVGIGPFSEQLNVVHTAPGSGKTALVRFLRDSLTGTTPAFAGMAQSTGRVVWSAADGLYHCRREPDGTNQGRRFVDFECRVGGYNAERFNRPAVVTDLPMSVVDGIVTDTALNSVRRVVQSLLDTGLDRFDTVDAGVTAGQADRAAELASLRSELVRLRDTLRQQGYAGGVMTQSQGKERLAALTLELEAIDARREFARQSDAAVLQRRNDRDAMKRAVDDVDRLRRQETDLRKRIASLDTTLERLEDQSRREHDLAAITQVARKRVTWINRQIQSLRLLLAEVRQLGDRWFSGRQGTAGPSLLGIAGLHHEATESHLDDRLLTRDELLLQDRGWLGSDDSAEAVSADRYLSPVRNGLGIATEIDSRLERLCQNVDRLVGRLEAEQQHWLAADQTAGELFGEAMSESEQALRRARRRAESRFDQHADAYVDGLAEGVLHRDGESTRDDCGWVEDSVRRQRIDSLHREQRRRRLDDLTDQQTLRDGNPDGSEDALLATMRSIGTVLHSLSRRLRGLKVQTSAVRGGMPEADWSLLADVYEISAVRLPQGEQTAAVRRCERELVATLTELVNHRAALVRRVATAQTQDIASEVQWLADPQSATETAAWADPSLPQASLAPRREPFADALARLSEDAGQTWNIGDDLWRLADARYSQSRHVREATRRRLEAERGRLLADLKQAVDHMNRQLTVAERLRLQLQTQLPISAAAAQSHADEQLRGRIEAEIRRLHHQLAALPANSQALTRYRQCVLRLRTLEAEMPAGGAASSRLASEASEHLRRLTAGRLTQVQWRLSAAEGTRLAQLDVQIDDRDEQSFDAQDRFLAAIAVRLAAADELSRRGRPLPLVIETPADWVDWKAETGWQADGGWHGQSWTDQTWTGQPGTGATDNDVRRQLVAVLSDVARRGRQIILLTSDRSIADGAVAAGGRGYGWDGSSYYRQAATVAAAPVTTTDWAFSSAAKPGRHTEATGSANAASWTTVDPLTPREPFDTLADSVVPASDPLDTQAVSVQHRDVVSFPTVERQKTSERTSSASESPSGGRGGAANAPFFLTGNSPIEQAPSIDALVVARLRALNIVTIDQFLAAAPAELAGRLQMAEVDAATVRRWQAECRLVSGVRGLRGFDARILVGCGIVHPREVLEAEPAELVEKIEAFLVTQRGSNLLQTGTEREVARLTRWLADARSQSRGSRQASHREDNRRSFTLNRPVGQRDQTTDRSQRGRSGETRPSQTRDERRQTQDRETTVRQSSGQHSSSPTTKTESSLRFYLQRSSAVVDAPSIGPRMAERLAALQILTVDDLLKADPARIASTLQLRRVDQATVRGWQQQATLVCRVPMLRGHDAQLLVAAGITQPERLAQCDPQWLLGQVEPVAKSREGQSILRGGSEPDLVEVTDWIRWAQSQRELKAA